MKRNDWEEMNRVSFEQALQLFEEGKPHFEVAQEARRAELRPYHSSGTPEVKILTTQDQSCSACQTFEGR